MANIPVQGAPLQGYGNVAPFTGVQSGVIMCHICGKVGHYARNCWSGGNGRPVSGPPTITNGTQDDDMKEMKEFSREKMRKQKADLKRREKEEEEKRRKEEENRREHDRLKEAEAREARMEARLVRFLAQHSKTVDRGESSVKKKSPKTKARMLREIRSYLVESEDDSEEVKEEAGKLIEAIERRKGKRKETAGGGVVSRNLRKGQQGDLVMVEEDDEVRTPPAARRGEGQDAASTDMLEFAIEMHRHLSEKKVSELRKLCNREGIEWSPRDVAIGELVKCKAKLAYGENNAPTNDPGVYAVVSPFCRHFYIGATTRKIIIRWSDHVKGAIRKEAGNAPKLHNWLKIFGWDKYLVLPLVCNASDPFVVESTLIRRFSPALNTQGSRKEGIARRKKKGKRERGKRNNNERGGSVILFNGKASIIDAILELKEDSRIKQIRSSGGVVWEDKWQSVKGKVGGCILEIGGKGIPLRECRKKLKEGGNFSIRSIVVISSSVTRRKNILRELMRRPGNIRSIYKLGSEEIINLHRTSGLFCEKKTHNHLRYAISNVARRKYGVEMRRRPCVKIPFSPLIRLGEVRRLTSNVLAQILPDKYIRAFVGRRVRVVLKKSVTVGGVIHNHWLYAGESEATCTFHYLDLPRFKRHVKVRLEHVHGIPAFVMNSKNVTRGMRISHKMLAECVLEGVKPWAKGKAMNIDRESIERCFDTRRGVGVLAMSTGEVREVMTDFQNLVAVPVDRNPGASLIPCPYLYITACKEIFNLSASFVEVFRSETEVLAEMKREYEEKGLQRVARWQTSGKVGHAYVLPKDKDLQRWRPILPCTHDPARLAGSRAGKAIRYMLFGLDRRCHFDLKSMDELREVCGRVESKLGAKADAAYARRYDVKEMFSRLSHQSILEAVAWLIECHKERGMIEVKVCARGKICAMTKRARKEEGFVLMSFEDIRAIVEFELNHTFVKCTGGMFKQIFGIPMGRNSIPAIACLVCACTEAKFVRSLGRRAGLVMGLRMIDDVAIIAAFSSDNEHSARNAEMMMARFEKCYDQELTLVKKDEGKNAFDFLGTRIIVQIQPLKIAVHPRTRNQLPLAENGALTIQSLHDYTSFSKKSCKRATVFSNLIRMSKLASSEEAMMASIAALMMEICLRGYPPEVSLGALARFARVSGGSLRIVLDVAAWLDGLAPGLMTLGILAEACGSF
ncbi:hypothetical protein CBR_g20262 [Chara braunii]|uniref:CCHC-type domain-containing protein n=1 Tax=Chara braunii TaxID=69332 RepID=A0A388L0A9_CHABU|nr:hypothetical protein CBR_g20262 [Chara braunii]|eukprot:GBG75633.1 hypothetical protein CBR_g20262 [Chara braunii]